MPFIKILVLLGIVMNSDWKKIPASELDIVQWDRCVAENDGAIFSLSWYWSAVQPSWQGWVKGDYEAILPDALTKKWGFISSNKTPLYVKYLECLGKNITPEGRSNIFQKVTGKGILKGIHIQPGVEIKGNIKKHRVQVAPYVGTNISRELRKNLQKAERENFKVDYNQTWERFTQFMKRHHPYDWPQKQQTKMHDLFRAGQEKGMIKIAGLSCDGLMVAMQLYGVFNGTLYTIQNASDKDYRELHVMSYLLHHLIEETHDKDNIHRIHFMGSSNKSVARFNKKFQAIDLEFSFVVS
ncbi:MAG: hypothetical protein RLY35_1016 [Bacteroidota bacterium]